LKVAGPTALASRLMQQPARRVDIAELASTGVGDDDSTVVKLESADDLKELVVGVSLGDADVEARLVQ